MIVRWGALKSSKDLSLHEFKKEWLEQHVPLVQYARGLRSYHQNLVIDSEQRSPFPRGANEFDGFAQLEFDSLDDMQNTMDSIRDNPAIDISHFASETSIFITVRKFDKRPPSGQSLIKRISLLSRPTTISAHAFQEEWWGEHSRLVAELDGYVGYAQNLVMDETISTGLTQHKLSIDGIVEFWFEDEQAMQRFYDSPGFAKVAKHGFEFIDEITTYLVEEHTAETGGY